MSALVSLLLAASIGPVSFPAPGGFLVLSRSGEVIEKVRRPGGMEPTHLSVSPDGSRYVFTAKPPEGTQPLLYRLERGEAKPTLLAFRGGFHAQPTFTNDGAWVFFIYHPTKDTEWGIPATVGEMEDRMYGQIYKVKVDGSGLEQVTTSRGCKLFPDARDSKTVAYTHTNCGATSMLELTTGQRVEAVLPMSTLRPHLPRLSSDGKKLATARLTADEVQLLVCVAKKCSQIGAVPHDAEPTQLAWVDDDSAVLVAVGPSIWRVETTGARREHLKLFEVMP